MLIASQLAIISNFFKIVALQTLLYRRWMIAPTILVIMNAAILIDAGLLPKILFTSSLQIVNNSAIKTKVTQKGYKCHLKYQLHI